jgi:hypothetical protein
MSTWQHIGSTEEETYTEACLSVAKTNERSVHRGLKGAHCYDRAVRDNTPVRRTYLGRLDYFVTFASLADSQVHEQVAHCVVLARLSSNLKIVILFWSPVRIFRLPILNNLSTPDFKESEESLVVRK